jgi:hypothetical protein
MAASRKISCCSSLSLSEYCAISHCFNFTLTDTTLDSTRITNNLACLKSTQPPLTTTTPYHHHDNHDRLIATNTLVRAVHSHQKPPQYTTTRRQDPPSTIRFREPVISIRQCSRRVQPPRSTSLRPLQLLHVLCISPGGITIPRSAAPAAIPFDISASKSRE